MAKMALGTVPRLDPHVSWLARWRELLAGHNDPSRVGDAPGELLGELLEIEERIVAVRPASRAGWMALAEITEYGLARELPADSFGLCAVAALAALTRADPE